MATTVAHGLIGISTCCVMISALPAPKNYSLGLSALLLSAVAANLPDLDMLVSLSLFSDHTLLHGGTTHSFAFAGLVAVLLWLIGRKRGVSPEIAVFGFFLVTSHVVVDWFTGPQWGLHPSHGLAPFWPFSDKPLQMPVTLFKGVIHGDLLPGALFTGLWELIILGPPTVGLIVLSNKIMANRRKQKVELQHVGVRVYR
jgi:membrane-bound metal-dependent hydrolase YbcI (DUF457 family)